MTPTQKLLGKLPKRYHDRVVSLEAEEDLCGGCKYMLYYSAQYTDGECYGSSYPVRSITEAIDYIKNNLHKQGGA